MSEKKKNIKFVVDDKPSKKELQKVCLFKVFVALSYSATFRGVNYGYKKVDGQLVETKDKKIYLYSTGDTPAERKKWTGKEVQRDKLPTFKGMQEILTFLEDLETEHEGIIKTIQVYANTVAGSPFIAKFSKDGN